MRIVWHFIGRAVAVEGRVAPIKLEDFKVGAGGPFALPISGDLLVLPIDGQNSSLQFKVGARTFDFASDDAPLLHIDLELVKN